MASRMDARRTRGKPQREDGPEDLRGANADLDGFTTADALEPRGPDSLAGAHAREGLALTDFDGIGAALAERLVKHFGSEEAFLDAARAMQIDRLVAVDGISERKAVDIVLRVQGRAASDFLRTPRAEALHQDILERIRSFASTTHAKNRIALLIPLRDAARIRANLAFALEARDEAAALPREDVKRLLSRIAPPRTPRPRFDGSLAILVDDERDRDRLVQAGADRHCQVLTPDDASGGADSFELVVYAYTQGLLDLSGAENVVQTPFTDDVGGLVPDATLAWYRENRGLFENVAALADLLGRSTRTREALALLDEAAEADVDFDALEAAVREECVAMNAEMKSRTGELSLTGDEVLAMMGGETPRKITALQSEILRAGRTRLRERMGVDWSVFTDAFPVAVDEAALEKRRREHAVAAKRDAFRGRVAAARRLAALRDDLEDEVRALLEFDYAFALGSFALEYDLHAPVFGSSGWRLEGALHLDLAGAAGAVAIDYTLPEADRVALLTGANSGGKTTLLETLAQVAILAHMGLPVPARHADVELVDAVYFFTQKRSLDAGAFESFLKGFLPIVTGNSRKLVLADELEAMTELDAAARIVGTFIDLLKASGSSGVCVTHMADEVSRYTGVRIDGIEAKGLDEDYNLVVDRTPRMNYRARSTPELILRRLESKASGEEKRVLEIILAKFRAG